MTLLTKSSRMAVMSSYFLEKGQFSCTYTQIKIARAACIIRSELARLVCAWEQNRMKSEERKRDGFVARPIKAIFLRGFVAVVVDVLLLLLLVRRRRITNFENISPRKIGFVVTVVVVIVCEGRKR